MKQGKTLVELAQAVQSIKESSRDFIVPVESLKMTDDAKIEFTNGQTHQFDPTSWAHNQISQYVDVPKAYYDRLRQENTSLLALNVNHGLDLAHKTPRRDGKTEARMLRTVGGKARAVLSSSYRRLDSHDLMNEVLPVMLDKKMEVQSCEITERRLYIKALFPKLQTEVKKGDIVQYGLTVSNSDVGSGSLRVEPLIYRLVCANGLITSSAIKKFHVGRNQAEDDIYELFSQDTRNMTEDVFWRQVRDVVLASMRPEHFEREVDQLRIAANEPIKNFDIPRVIELTTKAVGVSGEKVKQDMVAYLANGADGAGLTKWGLINAFTYAAQADHVDYDQSIELERAGAKVLELKSNQWKAISASAE